MIRFGCGVLLRETIHHRITWERFGNIAALVSFAVALTWFGLQDSQIVTSICGPIVTRSALTYGGLFISTYALGYYALGGNGFLAKFFSWDWLRWFGNISYSFYLTHGLALHFLKGGLEFLHLPAHLSPLGYLALGCATLSGTIVGSAAMFLLVEKRFLLSTHSSGASQLVPADAEMARS
jgi:peptidoglycan/LPS O-acetylase OafA/YrhL